MRWKKKHNKPVDFTAGVGGGIGGPRILILFKSITIGKVDAHGKSGGGHN
jgi:hypothetical protein